MFQCHCLQIEQKERSLKRKQGPLLPENWVPPHSDSDDSENEPPTKRQHTEVDQTSMNGEKSNSSSTSPVKSTI